MSVSQMMYECAASALWHGRPELAARLEELGDELLAESVSA